MEIKFTIDDDFMDKIRRDSGLKSNSKVVKESLMLLKWLLKEAKNGRILFSAEPEGDNIKKLIIPAFMHARELGKKEKENDDDKE